MRHFLVPLALLALLAADLQASGHRQRGRHRERSVAVQRFRSMNDNGGCGAQVRGGCEGGTCRGGRFGRR